ncbi:hypothetical protein DPEC_G00314340 [Dallia pectoralis]|uniref:Uncharacterized protein n=1 Tax=Dallia pectoralis TaxID=75939 RepID=A0ACC2FC47_DALPE|nr:hypothetical protein DPEC_G00314340 [Dallia pectoralis]
MGRTAHMEREAARVCRPACGSSPSRWRGHSYSGASRWSIMGHRTDNHPNRHPKYANRVSQSKPPYILINLTDWGTVGNGRNPYMWTDKAIIVYYKLRSVAYRCFFFSKHI